MSVPWTTSAVSLVRSALSTNRYLKSQDIWKMGTVGERPVLQPQIAFDANGRIRMRKAANIREGKVQWTPPPIKSLPEHPFMSKRFLKSNILRSLQAQGIIRSARIEVPLETKEDLIEAERVAAKRFRRAVLEAKRARLPPPTVPPPPRTTKPEYYWTVGRTPDPETHLEANAEVYAPFDKPMTAEEAAALVSEEMWDRAERLEQQFHKARLMEEENIEHRRAIRQAKYVAERAAEKAEKEEARAERTGCLAREREGYLAQERRRLSAIESIRQYAEQTGEDVSGWFEELENANLGSEKPEPIPATRPRQVDRIDGRVRLTPIPAVKNKNKIGRSNK